jgi:hypothetical protein
MKTKMPMRRSSTRMRGTQKYHWVVNSITSSIQLAKIGENLM